MINGLRALFIAVVFYMSWTVITTSLESNLISEWSRLAAIPWMTATLKDFYANTLIIALWMAYRESTWLSRTAWLAGFVCLGSIATSGYVLMRLFGVSANDSVERVLVKNP
jgi:hypothetical protein